MDDSFTPEMLQAMRDIEERVSRWGPWSLHEDDNTLDLWLDDGSLRRVDLDECETPDDTLNWIVGAANQPWGTPHVVGCLVRALADLGFG